MGRGPLLGCALFLLICTPWVQALHAGHNHKTVHKTPTTWTPTPWKRVSCCIGGYSTTGVSSMFTRTYVPRFMILFPIIPMFPSPYVVTQKCFPVPLLPKLILPSLCVPQYPCFPYSPVPYVSQSLCSPVPVLPSPFVSSPYRCSPVRMLPVPMFPQLIHQSPCSPHLFHKRVSHSLYSPNMFPSTYVPQCLCSPNLFPSPYVPPTSLPVPMYVPQSYSTEVFSIP